ncbi:hypothetical protein ABEW34_01690 [Paenibacillus algorifonticola]|uniref:hypothetical protein n=1 Tax=Paenibacillus algorifonticola TaxID=684063 RepID=UPI003D2CB037
MENKINDLLSDNKLSSKKELVSILIDRAEKKQSNQAFYNIFQHFLIESKVTLAGTFMMVGPKRGLSCFISEFLSVCVTDNNYEKQIQLLKGLLNDLNDLHESKKPLLKMTVAQSLLQLTNQFGLRRFLAYNSKGKPLHFYFVPYGNKNMNASYSPYFNAIVIYKNALDSKSSPEYIFMHELGHVFQMYMTKDSTKVPVSFKEATKGMFEQCSDEVMVEVFVDCFSVAIMEGTTFEDKNPFCSIFLKEHQIILKDYFSKILIEK